MVMTAILSVRRARTSLKQDLAETRDRFCFANPAEALKRHDRQHKVNEQTGAKRDEQKNAETTQSAVGPPYRNETAGELLRTQALFQRRQNLNEKLESFQGFDVARCRMQPPLTRLLLSKQLG